MEGNGQRGDPDRIEEVAALVEARIPEERRGATLRFVREYYRQVSPEDLAERAPADLYGAALSHSNLGRRRMPGSTRVRVYNPAAEEHGWQSTHTVIEVVTDDMPFLVDSVTMEVNRHGLTLHLFVHPILRVMRSADGMLEDVLPGSADDDDGRAESFMHVEVDRVADAAALQALAGDVERVLGDVRAATADWSAMTARVAAVAGEIGCNRSRADGDEIAENRAFLAWLADDHFVFLGYRCNDLVATPDGDVLRAVPGTGLGILRDEEHGLSGSFAALPPQARAMARAPGIVLLSKSSSRSTVHRPGHLDYVGVRRFDEQGAVVGEHRFLGLYTSTAYSSDPEQIPILRRKVARVIAGAGVVPGSHAAKALRNILETYPRDELFQIGEAELLANATGILHLGERQRFRLFVRRDPYERMVACLVYAPRENYTTNLRLVWQRLLMDAYHGTSADFSVFLSESALARVLIIVRTTPGAIPEVDVAALEARLASASRRWEDDLAQALVERLGEGRGRELYGRFGAAFPAAYREDVPARHAVGDVEMLARVAAGEALGMSLYRPLEAPPGTLRFKLLRAGAPIPLSDSLPMLENMGLRVLDERPYRVEAAGVPAVWIHDFGLAIQGRDDVDADNVHALFEDAFGRIFAGEVESDGFNRLVLAAQLPASDVTVLRAYARYMRQIGFPLSQAFIESTLAANHGIARTIVNLFKLRFDPAHEGGEGEDAAKRQLGAIEAALERVANLSEDRVLRLYVALVLATVRTNFWRLGTDGARRSYLSFKFDPAKVPGLPEPRPAHEIFVYSTRFEGVHLRGGNVSRGGLRWSDRPEDFRTEVLGLMKAQMVKNTVIVPVGSKGGFVLKKAPPATERDAYLKEGVSCYRDYLRGLLDLTDNLVNGAVVPPPQVRRLDADDSYLVVAADKGTASFSDYANAVSAEYGYWLGDAFASGGSAGYDHKAMGITARGAWESTKRHFRELGLDTQATDFTVVGIGDMSGDVFGNGMLLSTHIRLVAAFDHRHVFLDPDPDAAASFAERRRLFALPRSSWADYDAALISPGGGVWPRSAKSIPVSPQVRARLGVDAASLSPAELLSAILKAPVDLLYNGGIGTYVKASHETHAEVGDRANDGIRVDGRDLRCRVVVEGGNLGFTQLGRVEYALAGGHIYTDAIDNSAGVDTSDHEVNLKILLGMAIQEGELTVKQRNALLATMTDEVAALVLRDNEFQTQAISVTVRRGVDVLDAQERFIAFLEKAGRLDRSLEFLPDAEALKARRAARTGLTAPENSILLAYSKMWLFEELVASKVPDDEWVGQALSRYFPQQVRDRFAAWLPRHPLRREIIATYVTNSMLNRVGATFVHRVGEMTGATPPEVVRAYLLAREVFDFVPLWEDIESLNGRVDDAVLAQMLIETGRTITRATSWFLRSPRLSDPMGPTIAALRTGVSEVRAALEASPHADAWRPSAAPYVAAGVPEDLALRVASYDTVFGALDISEIAVSTGRPTPTVTNLYFGLSQRLGLGWLRERIGRLTADSHWQALARSAMRDDLAALARSLAVRVLRDDADVHDVSALIAAWQARAASALARTERMLAELRAVPVPDAAMIAVALRELRNIA